MSISKRSTAQNQELAAALIAQIRHFIAGAIMNNQAIADRLGIHTTDHQLMNFIELLGNARPADLARLSGLTTGGVTVALDRLEKAGYIHRLRNPKDRRSVIIRMDPRRRRQVHEHYRAINQGMAKIFSQFSEKELQVVLDFLSTTNAAREEYNLAQASQSPRG